MANDIAPARRLLAEGLGTGFLLMAVVGSGIMADRLTDDTALSLLCNTIPTGAILAVLILILGPVSGAHFNPAVTLVFALRRELAAGLAVAYVAAQVAGGLAGTVLAHLMFVEAAVQTSTTVRSGTGQWLAEAIACFGLVMTILGAVRYRAEAVPYAVGLYITSAYWFTASTSFANPAVTIARSITDTFSGIRPLDAPAFIVAQLVGAVLAAGVGAWLFAADRQPAATRTASSPGGRPA